MKLRYFLLGLSMLNMQLAVAEAMADVSDTTEIEAIGQVLKHHHGGSTVLSLNAERFEYQTNEGAPVFAWFAQGSWGSDLHKLVAKTEGEYDDEAHALEELEIQLLYSRAIAAFWDLQTGIRHDFYPKPGRSFVTFGLEGIAPYWLETDIASFLSDQGDVYMRLEIERDLLLSPRLILQPRVELNTAFSNDHAVGIASGLNTMDAALRLHYDLSTQFKPYLGINFYQSFGGTADLQRQEDEDTEQLSFVAGIKFWF